MFKYTLKHKDAQKPVRGSDNAAGFDLYAAEIIQRDQNSIWYDTGVAFEIPNGFYGDLRARSSVSEMGLYLANGAGVLDPDYRGTVQFRFYKAKVDTGSSADQRRNDMYEVGDRIGQVVFLPHYKGEITFATPEEFSDTERGEGGFGSTGTS